MRNSQLGSSPLWSSRCVLQLLLIGNSKGGGEIMALSEGRTDGRAFPPFPFSDGWMHCRENERPDLYRRALDPISIECRSLWIWTEGERERKRRIMHPTDSPSSHLSSTGLYLLYTTVSHKVSIYSIITTLSMAVLSHDKKIRVHIFFVFHSTSQAAKNLFESDSLVNPIYPFPMEMTSRS